MPSVRVGSRPGCVVIRNRIVTEQHTAGIDVRYAASRHITSVNGIYRGSFITLPLADRIAFSPLLQNQDYFSIRMVLFPPDDFVKKRQPLCCGCRFGLFCGGFPAALVLANVFLLCLFHGRLPAALVLADVFLLCLFRGRLSTAPVSRRFICVFFAFVSQRFGCRACFAALFLRACFAALWLPRLFSAGHACFRRVYPIALISRRLSLLPFWL